MFSGTAGGMRGARRALAVMVTVVGLALGVLGVVPAPGATGAVVQARKGDPRPNFVFISTDDQRLDDMRWMPYTRRLLGRHGVTFTGALSPHPLCCPARAEFVTGQYGQNNGVHHNEGVYGGYHALLQPGNTLASWLHDAGYQTAMAGKYLNGYKPDPASRRGWDHWNPSFRDVYSYRHTTFFADGARELQTRHVDDAVTDYVRSYIREFARDDAPFYVWASDLAPHDRVIGDRVTPPVPAPRHRGTLAGARNPARRAPSYARRIDHGPAPAHHVGRRWLQRLFEARIESLQAVDEGVRDIVRTLRRTGELSRTYIVFTSDNGFLMGEHGFTGKNYLFDEALRVPMIVRTPGRGRARASDVPVTSVDLAPTVADLAGATPGRLQDGASFADLLAGRHQAWRDTQLVQTGRVSRSRRDPGWEQRGVRTSRWTFGIDQRTRAVQLYDRARDPFETVNLARDPGHRRVVRALRARTRVLAACAGATCRRDFGTVPAPRATSAAGR
jgi:arylsulfatase A-like enzyme